MISVSPQTNCNYEAKTKHYHVLFIYIYRVVTGYERFNMVGLYKSVSFYWPDCEAKSGLLNGAVRLSVWLSVRLCQQFGLALSFKFTAE